jgi:hypothetical protein
MKGSVLRLVTPLPLGEPLRGLEAPVSSTEGYFYENLRPASRHAERPTFLEGYFCL